MLAVYCFCFPIKHADWTFKKALNKLLSFEKRNLEILPLVKFDFKIIQKSFKQNLLYHVFKSHFPYHRLASRSWIEPFQSCLCMFSFILHKYLLIYSTPKKFWLQAISLPPSNILYVYGKLRKTKILINKQLKTR